jgi:enterochelin esterase-like enzyme
LHIETSTGDAFYRANLALSRELKKNGTPHDLVVLPGPHDQPFLREAGTLEMLLWHDRALSGS